MSTRAQTLRKASTSRAQTSTSTNEVESAPSASAASTEKENRANGSAVGAAVKQEQPKAKAAGNGRARRVYCLCRQPDNGSPMILCSECKEWYHFDCVNVDDRDAEDIQLFVCPSCHDKTGLCSVMEWEGLEALEERNETTAPPRKSATPAPAPHKRRSVTVELELRRRKPKQVAAKIRKEQREAEGQKEEQEESSDASSADEYVAEKGKDKKGKGKPKAKAKRRTVTTDSETEGKSEKAGSPTKIRRLSTASTAQRTRTVSASVSASPEPAERAGRRRKSTSGSTQPPPKRKRTDTVSSQTQPSPSGGEDAARKYCLAKLQEIFCEIFLRYPVLHDGPRRGANDEGDEGKGDGEAVIDEAEELTEEEKEVLREKARKFSSDLEECMYELYAEPDKTGKHSVAAKYKERFRMLSFNLSKPDRVVLHKRIAASHIAPRELSTMSSTDLANEETKQSIRQAEQEALAHSILKKTLMPRAKITHKGLQDIEDVNGEAAREEREHEEEEEARIERERQERLKLQAQRAQAARASESAPPESPVTPHPPTPSWGAPPPIPPHAMHPVAGAGAGDASISRPALNPLFIPPTSDLITHAPAAEQELNLADLINIDEEPGQEVSISLAAPALPTPDSVTSPPEASAESVEGSASLSPPPATPSTGISPFASRASYPEASPRPSFDLNAIWTAPVLKEETDPAAQAEKIVDHDEPMHVDSPGDMKEASVDAEIIGEMADDQDFDMFLGGGEEEPETSPPLDIPEAQRAAFEALPKVWHGKLSMPLDSTMPQEVTVSARQMGGLTLGHNSPSWKVLFPSDHLRIDGRVPVDKSAQYLTAMRLNPNKELVAVAFSPDSETSAIAFDTLAKHLIAKGRHGLIFPWGNRPKEHHPGRELYIVPLLYSEPIPDFLELLDELRLPSSRNASYLIGIWVLNKGKLVAPGSSLTPPAHVETTVSIPAVGLATVPAPETQTPPQLPFSHLLPSAFQQPPSAPGQPSNINSAALAAEVASLTPDQIQLMLRSLTANNALPITTQPPAQLPSAQLLPAQLPPSLSSVPPAPGPQMQPWMNSLQNYQPPYPAAPVPPNVQPPGPPPSYGSPRRFDRDANSQPYSPNGGHQYDSFDRGGGDRGGGDRGGRGRGARGSWGRGRGQAQGQGQTERPRDSGWRGRARARGQSSPTRGQWDSPRQWS